MRLKSKPVFHLGLLGLAGCSVILMLSLVGVFLCDGTTGDIFGVVATIAFVLGVGTYAITVGVGYTLLISEKCLKSIELQLILIGISLVTTPIHIIVVLLMVLGERGPVWHHWSWLAVSLVILSSAEPFLLTRFIVPGSNIKATAALRAIAATVGIVVSAGMPLVIWQGVDTYGAGNMFVLVVCALGAVYKLLLAYKCSRDSFILDSYGDHLTS